MTQMRDCRFPNSANLFSFCKIVLSSKFGNSRVIDQDVGQILDFDPADCSHWKRGRKSIRSFDEIQAIAKKLGVDEQIVLDVARGKMSASEALLELQCYSLTSSYVELLAVLRAQSQINGSGRWTPDTFKFLQDYLHVVENKIDTVVTEIHKRINFQEAPLFFPAVCLAYPAIKIFDSEIRVSGGAIALDLAPRAFRGPDGAMVIHVLREATNLPRIRFLLAEILSSYFLSDLPEPGVSLLLAEQGKVLERFVQSAFAGRLLVPADLVKAELQNVDLRNDLISQLAERFWVSRNVINRRLKEIIAGKIV